MNLNFNFLRKQPNKLVSTSANSNVVDSNNLQQTATTVPAAISTIVTPSSTSLTTTTTNAANSSTLANNNNNNNHNIAETQLSNTLQSTSTSSIQTINLNIGATSNKKPFQPITSPNSFVLPSLNQSNTSSKLPLLNTSSSASANTASTSSSNNNFFSINKPNVNNNPANKDIIRNKLNDAKAFLDSETSQLKLNIESPLNNNNANSFSGGSISRPPILTPINNPLNALSFTEHSSSTTITPIQRGNRRENLKPFDFRTGGYFSSNSQNTVLDSSSPTPPSSSCNNSFNCNKGMLALRFQLGGNNVSGMGTSNEDSAYSNQLTLNLPSSSRSSSASSQQSHSLSSSSSSLATGGSNGGFFGNHASRLEAVNSEKYREIMKNTGYLLIDEQRIKTSMDDLSPVCELGSGTCGHVIKMKHNMSGRFVAVKQMRISGVLEENKRIIMDLDVVLKCYDCPNIVKCLGYFISESDVWICMELMNMCFDKLLKLIKEPVPEPILGKLTVSTLNALSYLKDSHNLIHRDIKPSNILIDNNGNIKLCDFGISGNLINSNVLSRNNLGSAGYMAPERIDPEDPSNPVYDIRADVWSLGVTLVELGTGKYPYKQCQTEFEVMTTILQYDPPILEGDQFSDKFKSFVNQCLIKDVKKRPKYNILLQHPFITHYKKTDVDVKSWFRNIIEATSKPNLTTSSSAATPTSSPNEQLTLSKRSNSNTNLSNNGNDSSLSNQESTSLSSLADIVNLKLSGGACGRGEGGCRANGSDDNTINSNNDDNSSSSTPTVASVSTNSLNFN